MPPLGLRDRCDLRAVGLPLVWRSCFFLPRNFSARPPAILVGCEYGDDFMAAEKPVVTLPLAPGEPGEPDEPLALPRWLLRAFRVDRLPDEFNDFQLYYAFTCVSKTRLFLRSFVLITDTW